MLLTSFFKKMWSCFALNYAEEAIQFIWWHKMIINLQIENMLINLHTSLQNFRNDRQSAFIVNNLFSICLVQTLG